jgi:hypothetical protein
MQCGKGNQEKMGFAIEAVNSVDMAEGIWYIEFST